MNIFYFRWIGIILKCTILSFFLFLFFPCRCCITPSRMRSWNGPCKYLHIHHHHSCLLKRVNRKLWRKSNKLCFIRSGNVQAGFKLGFPWAHAIFTGPQILCGTFLKPQGLTRGERNEWFYFYLHHRWLWCPQHTNTHQIHAPIKAQVCDGVLFSQMIRLVAFETWAVIMILKTWH